MSVGQGGAESSSIAKCVDTKFFPGFLANTGRPPLAAGLVR